MEGEVFENNLLIIILSLYDSKESQLSVVNCAFDNECYCFSIDGYV